jgi:hypothetical protein
VAVGIRLIGGKARPAVSGRQPRPWRTNYFVGGSRHARAAAGYGKVEYSQVYRGIDLVYYGNQRQLEYDFIVAPGADPDRIKLAFTGVGPLAVDAATGRLDIPTDLGTLAQRAPVAYQVDDAGGRVPVACRYVARGNNQVGFALGSYDRTRPLVIDPVLVYSSYVGTWADELGGRIAVDNAGCAYLVGNGAWDEGIFGEDAILDNIANGPFQGSAGPPVPPSAYAEYRPCVFVTKFTPNGGGIVYSSVFADFLYYPSGGDGVFPNAGDGLQCPTGIAVDITGCAYVADLYGRVAKLSADGADLLYLAHVGIEIRGIAVDASGCAHLAGAGLMLDLVTPPEPRPHGGYNVDACVAKLNAAGSALEFLVALSRHTRLFNVSPESVWVQGGDNGASQLSDHVVPLGHTTRVLLGTGVALATPDPPPYSGYNTPTGLANGFDGATGVAVGPNGDVFVTGITTSGDFPVTTGAYQTQFADPGGLQCFVAKMSGTGQLLYSTFLGGPDKAFRGDSRWVWVPAFGDINNVPTTAPTNDRDLGYFGDFATSVAVDNGGCAYVTGYTSSDSFPTTPGALCTQKAVGYGFAGFVTKFNPVGSALVYSTLLNATVGAAPPYAASPLGPWGADAQPFRDEGPLLWSTLEPCIWRYWWMYDDSIGLWSFDPYLDTKLFSDYFKDQSYYGYDIWYDIQYNWSDDAYLSAYGWGVNGAPIYPSGLFGLTLEGIWRNFVYASPGGDFPFGICLDAGGNAYVAGATSSPSFPTTGGPQAAANQGRYDAFVTKLNASGSAIVYSQLIGGNSFDVAYGVALDGTGHAYIAGTTTSENLPTSQSAFQRVFNGAVTYAPDETEPGPPISPYNGDGLLLNDQMSGSSHYTYFGPPKKWDVFVAKVGRQDAVNGDIDGDGIPNDQDPDMDGDGIPNDQDPDMDGDGIPNASDPDANSNGIPDDEDNLPPATGGGGTVGALDCGQEVSGMLAAADGRSLGWSQLGQPGYHGDRYRVIAAAGQTVTVTVSSPSFDTHLFLLDARGNVLGQSADFGGGTDSRIVFPITHDGTYVVEVTSDEPGAVGGYDLALCCATPGDHDGPGTEPDGCSAIPISATGTDAPEYWSGHWEVRDPSGNIIAAEYYPQGWTITYDPVAQAFGVCAPADAISGTGYEVRWTATDPYSNLQSVLGVDLSAGRGNGAGANAAFLALHARGLASVDPDAGSASATFRVFPHGCDAVAACAPPSLIGFSLDREFVTAGELVTGTLRLSGPALTGGVAVTLASNHTAAAVPNYVTVPAGQDHASFTIRTNGGITAIVQATLTATYATATLSAGLVVRPAPTGGLDAVAVARPVRRQAPSAHRVPGTEAARSMVARVTNEREGRVDSSRPFLPGSMVRLAAGTVPRRPATGTVRTSGAARLRDVEGYLPRPRAPSSRASRAPDHDAAPNASTALFSLLSASGNGSMCSPMDVAFVVDTTGSMGGTIENVKKGLVTLLDDIQRASGGDYRLALVTVANDDGGEDYINVAQTFAPGNRNTFEQQLRALSAPGSGGPSSPEIYDEALRTVIEGLPGDDARQQVGDFDIPFRPVARKVIILVTDAPPGGFDDNYTPGIDDANAHEVAISALNRGIRISAVYASTNEEDYYYRYGGGTQSPPPSPLPPSPAMRVMQDLAATTYGVYTEIDSLGNGAADALVNIAARCGTVRTSNSLVVHDVRDGSTSYAPILVDSPDTRGVSPATAAFDLTSLDPLGRVAAAHVERRGGLTRVSAGPFDVQFGIAPASPVGGFADDYAGGHAGPLPRPFVYNDSWELARAFLPDIQGFLGQMYHPRWADRISGACASYRVIDSPASASTGGVSAAARLTVLVAPQGNPKVRQEGSLDITVPDALEDGVPSAAHGAWEIVLDGDVLASEAQKNGWDAVADDTVYRGVIVHAPATAPLANGYEVRFRGTDRAGGGIFDVVDVNGQGVDFTLAADPSDVPITVVPGQSGSADVIATPVHGFAGTVELSLWNAPTGITGAFAPVSVVLNGTTAAASVLTVTVDASVPPGTYKLFAVGRSGGISHVAEIPVVVTPDPQSPQPDFQISDSPHFVYVDRPGSATSTLTVQSLNGFSGTVRLAVGLPLPAGVTATLAPASVTLTPGGSATSTLTLTASASAAVGSTTVSYSGRYGTLEKTGYVYLYVQEPAPAGAPPAPLGLTAEPGDQEVFLRWEATPGATGYTLGVAPQTGGPYSTIYTGSNTEYTHTGLTNGTTYYYVVTASNAAGQSAASNEANATPHAAELLGGQCGLFDILGYDAPEYPALWDVVSISGTPQVVASSVLPNGWYVSLDPQAGFVVCPPANAPPGRYEVRYLDGEWEEWDDGNGQTYHWPTGPTYSTYVTLTSGGVGLGGPVTLADIPAPSWAEDVLPTDGGGAGTASGPSAGHSVNLASGVYEYSTGPDIVAPNAYGPNAYYARRYRSKLAADLKSAPGLPAGWTDNYNVWVTANATGGGLTLTYPNDAQDAITVSASGSGLVAHGPAQAPYRVEVDGPSPSLPGAPYAQVRVIFRDDTRWVFTPTATDPTRYALRGMVNALGTAALVDRAGEATGDLRVTGVSCNGQLLLRLEYDSGNGYLKTVTDETPFWYAGGRRRSVEFRYGKQGGVTLLTAATELAYVGDPHRPQRTYGYWLAGGVQPFLNTVGVPGPNRPGGLPLVSKVGYDAATGKAESLLDGNGNTRNYLYLSAGRTKVEVRDATPAHALVGHFTQKYDPANNNVNTGVKDALDEETNVGYDGYREVSFQNKRGQTVTVQYDPAFRDRILSVTDPRSVVTNYTYYPDGRLWTHQIGGLTPTTYHYNALGQVDWIDTPRPGTVGGQTVRTEYTYTALGNIKTTTAPGPNGHAVTWTYEYENDPITTPGLEQYSALFRPERLGKPLRVTGPPVTNRNGASIRRVTHYRYDSLGYVDTVIDAQGRARFTQRNAAGQVLRVQHPQADARLQGVGAEGEYFYAYTGGPMIQLIDSAVSQWGLRTRVRHLLFAFGGEAEGRSVSGDTQGGSTEPNAFYGTASATDGNRKTTAFNHDVRGMLKGVRLPGDTADVVDVEERDADGQVKKLRDGRLVRVVTTTAPEDGRVTDVEYKAPDGTVLRHTHYDHDLYGRVLKMTDATGDTSYIYDDTGNLLSATTRYGDLPAGLLYTVSYAYNDDGSVQSMTTPGAVFSYTYNDAGDLTGVSPSIIGAPAGLHVSTLRYDYDALGRVVWSDIGPVATTYAFNGRGLPQSLENNNQITGALMSRFVIKPEYYDAMGRRTRMNVTLPKVGNAGDYSGYVEYAYDNRGRLYRETRRRSNNHVLYDDNFTWDNVNNLVAFAAQSPAYQQTPGGPDTHTFAQTVDGQNRVSGPGFDGNGNQQSLRGDTLTYDAEDNLTEIAGRLRAAYKGNGLRAWKENLLGGTPQRTYFVYADGKVICELNSSGQVVNTYVYGATGLAMRYLHAVGYRQFTYDLDGNLVQTIRQTQSNPAHTSVYDSRGRLYVNDDVLGNTAGTERYAVGASGQSGAYMDQETYAGPFEPSIIARGVHAYYDPNTGRALQRIGGPSDAQYSYTNGNADTGFPDEQTFGENITDALRPFTGKQGLMLVGETKGVALPLFMVASSITGVVDGWAVAGTVQGQYDGGGASKWALLGAYTNAGVQTAGLVMDGAGPLAAGITQGMSAFRAFRAVRGMESAFDAERLMVRCLEEGQCFAAGTPVWVAEPKDRRHPGRGADPAQVHTKPIERVAKGDWVVSRDVKSGRLVFRRVTGTSERSSQDALQLHLADARTGKVSLVLVATLNHPFYVTGKGWVDAAKLGIGTSIVTRAGPRLVVKKVSRAHSPAGVAVYNLEIVGTHNYFVGTTLGGALVHNGAYSWKSKDFGHTFSDHGQGSKITNALRGRANSPQASKTQGQWLSNEGAATYLGPHLNSPVIHSPKGWGSFSRWDVPDGMAQIIRPDGSTFPTNRVEIVPWGGGKPGIRTAFPVP